MKLNLSLVTFRVLKVLPQVEEDEIESKKAAEIKYSPLPTWLETLIVEYTKIHKGNVSKSLLGFMDISIEEDKRKVTFDSEVALGNPDVEHITLQHDWVRKILSDISEFESSFGVPIIQFNEEDETAGYWSLWQVTAENHFEKKTHYQCFFLAENGKLYAAYANDIWSRLIASDSSSHVKFKGVGEAFDVQPHLNDSLFQSYQNLEADVIERMNKKRENKINSDNFQKSRINKIGIENIRLSKLRRLEKSMRNG